MSKIRHARTISANSPSVAMPSDAGVVPLRRSYSTDVRVQDGDLSQSYDGFKQLAFTHVANVNLEAYPSADTELASPHSLQQCSPSMQILGPGRAPHSIARAPYSTSSPSPEHEAMMEQSGLQQWASDPARSTAAAVDMSQYEQHVPESGLISHQIHNVHDQHLADNNFAWEVYQQQVPHSGYPQHIIDHPYADASPYPDPLPVEAHHTYYVPQGWQAPSDDDTGGNGGYGYDGKLNTSYAHLIYMCLLEAPNRSRKLKEIYDWIKIRTNKADDLTTNGWQNSVRHNLSMNEAFLKPSEASGGKKLGYWRLDPIAIANGGVRPTSAHRTKSARCKSTRKGAAAPQRANAGAKGGQATRDTRMRREGKHPVRHHMAVRNFVPPPPAPQPYYSYPTPERALADSSVENTPMFGAPAILTPASTLSPQSAWQSPCPDPTTHNELSQWTEFEFTNPHHSLLPASGAVSSSSGLEIAVANPGVSFEASSTCNFTAGPMDDQGFSAFSDTPELGYEHDDGLQGVLQRQLDEFAALPVH